MGKFYRNEIESGPWRGRTYEAQQIFGRADHWDIEGAGGGCGNGGDLPPSRYFECDLLQVEGQVWRAGGFCSPAVEGAGERERPAEEASGGIDAE